MDLFSLGGKVAVVTGSSRGIGRAIAVGLARAGADLVLVARSAQGIAAAAQEAQALGRRALGLAADVTDRAQIERVVERAVQEYGRIDILVNNVGGSPFACAVEDIQEGGFDKVFHRNVKSMFLCCQAVGRIMRSQGGGCIINMASVDGRHPTPGLALYGAAKAAVVSFTQTLAVEWARYNIRVNALAPGLVETDMTASFLATRHAAEVMRAIPLRRAARPQDIVGAAIFLASEASAYMTGEVVYVSGGPLSIGLPPQ